MNDDMTDAELTILHHLTRWDYIRTGSIPATDALASLTAAGYIETTWADRVRLTTAGRELFQVASA